MVQVDPENREFGMIRHSIFIGIAVAIGFLGGSLAQIVLTALAYLSLIGGPGLYEGLLALADRPDVFWIVTVGVAVAVAALIYLIWGIVWLVGRRRQT
jgi:hypothetical protein